VERIYAGVAMALQKGLLARVIAKPENSMCRESRKF